MNACIHPSAHLTFPTLFRTGSLVQRMVLPRVGRPSHMKLQEEAILAMLGNGWCFPTNLSTSMILPVFHKVSAIISHFTMSCLASNITKKSI